ncbi:hypothetical protein PA27867_2069 [Cryobacterium arcticum]|uniref:Uncharacterized protein n=2 Tax=Cryobacterium arcticum TaxID=670052 RepID=A0A1B1BKF6_9MICO|nr:hypothetical protein PA27867_2069 [Cryobacterium arcticum]
METIQLGDGHTQVLDHKAENIHATTMGMAVDYLSRLANGAEPGDAFQISIRGAVRLHAREVITTLDLGRLTPVVDVDYLRSEPEAREMEYIADALLNLEALRPGLIPDDDAIRAAVHLVGYDIAFRVGPDFYVDQRSIPDAATIAHIRTMVERAVAFFTSHGPITEDGFRPVNRQSMTEVVDSGDGDFLTADTLWDFKVSVSPPTNKHTLQLLMYLIMGRHSGQDQYGSLTHLGIFNPRLNTVYRFAYADVPGDVVSAVSHDVIGYALA